VRRAPCSDDEIQDSLAHLHGGVGLSDSLRNSLRLSIKTGAIFSRFMFEKAGVINWPDLSLSISGSVFTLRTRRDVKGSAREGKVGEYSRKDIAETPINQIDSEAELSSRSPRKTILASLKSVVMICSVSTKELLSIGTIHHQSEGC
jgi:hypothetical protein